MNRKIRIITCQNSLFKLFSVYDGKKDCAIVFLIFIITYFSEFLNNINIALLSLSKPFEIGDEKITVPFEVAVASKSRNVNISVLPTLKNIMRSSTKGAVSVTDLDVEIHDDSQ